MSTDAWLQEHRVSETIEQCAKLLVWTASDGIEVPG